MSPSLPHINVEVVVNICDRQYGVIDVSWYTSTLNKGEGKRERTNLPNIFHGGCRCLYYSLTTVLFFYLATGIWTQPFQYDSKELSKKKV